MRHPLSGLPAVAAVAGLLVLSACGSSSGTTNTAEAAPVAETGNAPPALISADRCAENKKAGKITYITGYQWQASAGILEEVAAADLGYYKDLCLDVTIQPGTGDTAQNAQLVAAGTAQLTALGSEAEVLTARAGGVDVTGVATYGHVPIATLMTMPKITDLKQLDGTTLGQKGALPAPLRAMLVKAGVDVGSIKQVTVGYDPSVLPRGQVQSLTGYKSNEPGLLAAAGTKITQWNPEDYGVSGSFAAVAANPGFLKDHPTAAQDFLRASAYAFEHCKDNAQECVDLAAKRAGSGYDPAHNLDVWKIEQGLVTTSTPSGKPLGYLDPTKTTAEGEDVVASGQLKSLPDVSTAFDASYLTSVYSGATLTWPAP